MLADPANHQKWDFNPRFPRGKRLYPPHFYNAHEVISIHASRGGSDYNMAIKIEIAGEFQSTLPAGEATITGASMEPEMRISIHASRGGSDLTLTCFSSHSARFQSTLPAGEAT